MINAAVGRRYAKALLNAVGEVDGAAAERVAADLEALAATIERFNGLELVVLNPALDASKKAGVLAEVAERLEVSDITKRFIQVLAERERLDHLGAVAGAFRVLADEQGGVISAEITAPKKLGEQEIAALRDRLAEATGRQVRLTIHTDPELLGGLVTRIGDVIYDGSLRHQLDRMRVQMTKG